jgi:nucleotide-binding universal stress UspA family protein
MLKISKILLPADFPLSTEAVLHQASILAHHFGSELVLLHVVTNRSQAAGVPVGSHELEHWDLLAAIIAEAQKHEGSALSSDLKGLTVRAKLAKGDVDAAIIQTAQAEHADLIMMPSHSFTFSRFLLGSVTAKVFSGTECPLWTGAHVESTPAQDFAIRNVLCAVEFGPRRDIAVSWAAKIAEEFGAHLTLAKVTAGVEMWGPGGDYVNQRWKDDLVGDAKRQMDQLLQETGVKASVIIDSGDVPQVLAKAVNETKADLLVNGCYPYGGNLRTHGFGIIHAVPIPVLSV